MEVRLGTFSPLISDAWGRFAVRLSRVVNHRLRNALLAAEMTQTALAEAVGVDAKSVERWITKDRQPHPRTRAAVARVLGFDETYFWPALLGSAASIGAARAELVQVWPTRNDVP